MENTKFEISIQELAPLIAAKIAENGTVEMTVPGRSMEPTLIDRVSKVRLGRISSLKRGDVILYRRGSGQFVLHRIVDCCGDGTYVLCGDAQYRLESDIRQEQVLAVMTHFARRGRWTSCHDFNYQLWWRICTALRPCRHLRAAVWRRIRRLIQRKNGT